MSLPAYIILDVALLASEATLALSRRAGEKANPTDRGSLRRLWIVISAAMTAGHVVALGGVGPYLGGRACYWAGVGLFIFGSLLRRWAIRHLGRFFTVDVSVVRDQRVVDDGPYRFVRHPTYTGLLLEFLGIALVLRSVTGLLVIMVPIILALLQRVHIEEAALVEGLGEPYAAYMRRTRRFVPGVV